MEHVNGTKIEGAEKLDLQPLIRPNLIRMSDVEAEEIDWLWQPYIARRKLTLVEGNPGSGKTFGMLAVAATLTRGWPLPDASGVPRVSMGRAPENVLLLTCEDGLGDTIRPRLDRAKANADRVIALDGSIDAKGNREPFTFQHLSILDRALAEVQPALVIIDPIQGFLGSKVDMNAANEVRPLLSGLSRLAEQHGCAIVAIRHLRKSGSDHATQRGLGSIDFSAAARSILLFAENPTSQGQYVIAHSKSSLAPRGASLAFSLEGETFRWDGLSDLTHDDLLRPPRPEGDEADPETEFLLEALATGPRPARDIEEEAKELGFTVRTIRRRANELGVKKTKSGYQGAWTWALPRAEDSKGDSPVSKESKGATQIFMSPLDSLSGHVAPLSVPDEPSSFAAEQADLAIADPESF